MDDRLTIDSIYGVDMVDKKNLRRPTREYYRKRSHNFVFIVSFFEEEKSLSVFCLVPRCYMDNLITNNNINLFQIKDNKPTTSGISKLCWHILFK